MIQSETIRRPRGSYSTVARRVRRIPGWTASCLFAALGCGIALFAYSPAAQASHLRNAGEARLQEILKIRLKGLPSRFRQIAIPPSPTPRELPSADVELPGDVYNGIVSSSIQSFLYWDGKAIKHDLSRQEIDDDLPVYGMSMSKSITSYLLGRALCERLIDSLDDPIKKYVPALDGTFYGDAKIRHALDMTSGDRELYSVGSAWSGTDAWKDYLIPVVRRGIPIVDAMRKLGNRKPSENAFTYRNANADAVGMVLSAVSPGGLGKFASRTLARDAGFEHPAMYLADRNGAALAFGYFYATRLDWLRAAVFIGEQFKAQGCIGDYLRSAVSESVPTNLERRPYTRYGKLFWGGYKGSNRKHVLMGGHGGQKILIDLEDGRVMYILSIRQDYDHVRITEAVFE